MRRSAVLLWRHVKYYYGYYHLNKALLNSTRTIVSLSKAALYVFYRFDEKIEPYIAT